MQTEHNLGVLGSSCKKQIYTGRSGSFKSPNFPNYYPTNVICEYDIIQPPGVTIVVEFLEFQLEPNKECVFDSLAVCFMITIRINN